MTTCMDAWPRDVTVVDGCRGMRWSDQVQQVSDHSCPSGEDHYLGMVDHWVDHQQTVL